MPGVQGRARSSARVVHARRPLTGTRVCACVRVCRSPRTRPAIRARPFLRAVLQVEVAPTAAEGLRTAEGERRVADRRVGRHGARHRRCAGASHAAHRRADVGHRRALLVASYNSVQHGWLRHFDTGPVLAMVLDDAELTRQLLRVGVHCRVVMACRVSPLQKAKARCAALQHVVLCCAATRCAVLQHVRCRMLHHDGACCRPPPPSASARKPARADQVMRAHAPCAHAVQPAAVVTRMVAATAAARRSCGWCATACTRRR